jgi:hypothetical protein
MWKKVITLLIFLSFLSVVLPGDVKSQKPAKPEDDFRVIGEMSGTEILRKLAEIGDSDDARDIAFAAIKRTNPSAKITDVLTVQDEQLDTLVALNRSVKPYLYATRAFGYLATTDAASNTLVDVKAAGLITADTTLRAQPIKITLDRLRIFDYPGKGIHNVLFDFAGRHQAEATTGEDLHFTQTYRAPEGEGASISGVPIFVGLKVGNEGVFFSCKTVNVSNEDDEKLLGFLDGDIFKKGLQLLNSINPVVPIVTGFADGITRQIAARNNNVPVQNIDLGLDFSTNATRAKLREGSYIAVQAPDGFDITTCKFNPTTGDFVEKATGKPLPLNYIVFSISKVAVVG